MEWTYDTNDRVTIETRSNGSHITSILAIDSVIPGDSDVYLCTASVPYLTGYVSYNLVVGM